MLHFKLKTKPLDFVFNFSHSYPFLYSEMSDSPPPFMV